VIDKDKEPSVNSSISVSADEMSEPVDPAPAPRDGVTSDEARELDARAVEIVRQVEEASGSKEMEVIDAVSAVGIEAQRQGGKELESLRVTVAEMLATEGVASQVTKDLVQLRIELGKIAPASNGGSAVKILRAIPFSGGALRQLERIAIRYESVSRQVMTIEHRLAEGRAMLRNDNTQLRQLYQEVEAQQAPIARNIYLGNALASEIEKLLERTTDARKKERIQTLLFDVTMRVQDLQTMREVHAQFFVSIELTRVNNSRLAQAVDRTLSLTTSTLTVGLALQAALSNQRRVLDATRRTREFLGDLVVANAASIKQHATEIGDVYREPVLALEKLEQAHRDLVEAVDIAAKLEVEGIAQARANIQRLERMTEELTEKSGALPTTAVGRSLEA
jgi:uncharacterized protein YaaN involved in tellurite resistance